jgi:hypothetical protein
VEPPVVGTAAAARTPSESYDERRVATAHSAGGEKCQAGLAAAKYDMTPTPFATTTTTTTIVTTIFG